MGKRSAFERRPQDFYPTPAAAVAALLPQLWEQTAFLEPCAGDGALIDHLQRAGHRCGGAWDIEPRRGDIKPQDARFLSRVDAGLEWQVLITNPPWARPLLHELITHLSNLGPTWLLIDADWIHTRQAAPYLPRLRKIVAVGRVKWIPDSKFTGKDNVAWHYFTRPSAEPAHFYGRLP